jgi:hypothetical protein
VGWMAAFRKGEDEKDAKGHWACSSMEGFR